MIEARTDSLYQRLKARGLFESVMARLLDEDEKPEKMARWLKLEGIGASRTSVFNLVRNHGLAWRCEEAERAEREAALPADVEERAATALRRTIAKMKFEARSHKEVALLAKIQGDTAKIKVQEGRLEIVRAEAQRKIVETRMKGAQFILDVLNEAGRMERLRQQHANNAAAGASVAKHLEDIIREVWGDQSGASAGIVNGEERNGKEAE